MFALVNFNRQPVGIVVVAGHQCRHKGCWVVGLKIGCPICDGGVARGVGFRKGIVGELFQLQPQFFNNLLFDTGGFHGTVNELLLHFGQNIALFLTDGFAQRVGLTAGETAHILSNLHNLFLVNHNAVGWFQGRPHNFVQVFNFTLTMFAGDKIFNPLHWPRTVQGIHGNQVIKLRRD